MQLQKTYNEQKEKTESFVGIKKEKLFLFFKEKGTNLALSEASSARKQISFAAKEDWEAAKELSFCAKEVSETAEDGSLCDTFVSSGYQKSYF